MDVVLEADTTPGNISIIIAVFAIIMPCIWLCELWYLKRGFRKRSIPF